MSVQGPIPVEFGAVFPSGAYAAGAFDPVRNFDASTGEKFVQSHDKATGLPLWVIEVIDPDPAARTRAVKVKVAAQVQPVIPAGPPGSPFAPVEFTGMTVTPYVNQAGRLAYSIKATGIRAPGRGRPGRDKGGSGMKSGGGSMARTRPAHRRRLVDVPVHLRRAHPDPGHRRGSTMVTVCIDGSQMTASAVEFARELAGRRRSSRPGPNGCTPATTAKARPAGLPEPRGW